MTTTLQVHYAPSGAVYYEPVMDLIHTVPFAERASKVTQAQMAWPPGDAPLRPPSFDQFWRSLPDVLAAKAFREVVQAVRVARACDRGVLWGFGGHVIKVGLGPLIVELLRRRFVTHVMMNGAAAIHDFELGWFGATSEDVAAGLEDGTFGMAEETGREFNQVTKTAYAQGLGLGEALAENLSKAPHPSVLGACHTLAVPVTVHPALGAEIVHQHPHMNGACVGEVSARDFRRLAGATLGLHGGGVVLHWGSAVVLPEVFLKALTIARNTAAGRPTDFLAVDFDMQRQYRPTMNIVQRPTAGRGVSITGHHELMFPLLAWALLGLPGD